MMNRNICSLAVLLAALLATPNLLAEAVKAVTSTTPAKPPLPPIKELLLEPATLTLTDARDARRVLVWGKTESGDKVDLTTIATAQTDSSSIQVDSDGYISPKAKGEGEVLIKAEGKTVKLSVKVLSAEKTPVRFVRDILPVISKAGCNQGTCHGSAKGKNGFKLSLRGYDPDYDYQALINDLSGRRFNRVAVDESLMLLKPTGDVPHEGRQAIKPDSKEYNLLRQWIAEGTKYEDPAAGRANKLEIVPAEVNLALPGMTQQILVIAHYPDGSTRDVTREVVLSSNNGDVAEIKDGIVKGVRRGEAAILIRYEGNYAAQEVTVMGDRSGFAWKDVPEYNYVDQKVNAKLKRMKILPSELCTDAEFIRRVRLDLTGRPATSAQVRNFLADKTPSKEKREKLIDQLLASKDYVDFWANKWADLLQCNSESLGQKGVWVYRDWIRRSIAENRPYDKFVRDLILASGSSYENPAVNYFRVLREPGKITEDVSQTFLGVRFNCNKCHDHPFERWTQNQYYEFGAYFADIAIKRGRIGTQVIKDEAGGTAQVTAEEVIYHNYNGGEVEHPKTGTKVAPKVPFGNVPKLEATQERREAFASWLTSKENPFFAKSMANRVWSYFFGIGIIDPVDDIRASNPPSNPALLDALTEEFIRNDFDVRKLMKTICNSRSYQLSFIPNQWNEDDKINFAKARPRRLSAEQLADAVATATGTKEKFAGVPAGMHATEIPDGKVAGDDFLSLFGRPKRQSACECERTSNLTLSHAMSLINGGTVGDAVNSPDSRIKQVVETEKDDQKVVEELYLSILNRPPNEKEMASLKLSNAGSRLEAAQDLAWALLNSPAFLFNR